MFCYAGLPHICIKHIYIYIHTHKLMHVCANSNEQVLTSEHRSMYPQTHIYIYTHMPAFMECNQGMHVCVYVQPSFPFRTHSSPPHAPRAQGRLKKLGAARRALLDGLVSCQARPRLPGSQKVGGSINWGGPVLGDFVIRIIVHWDLFWAHPIFGNSQGDPCAVWFSLFDRFV